MAVAAAGLLALTTWSAPAPREPAPVKTPAGGVPAEPAGGDDEAAARHRQASANNLRQLAIAVHAFADDHAGRLPRDVTDTDGKVLLSWRVRLLPYLDQADLYKEFQLDQPWDSDHNRKLLARMPKVFASPRVRVREAGHTVYQGFAGPGAVFEPGKEWGLAQIPDGTSVTILAVEASVAVAWTRPADLPFDGTKDLPDFGQAYAATPLAVLCDGSVRTLDLAKLTAATLKAAITTAGGEVLGADW